MKICVYAITKNEAKFAEKWANNVKDADYVVVADTGSTDDTVEILSKFENIHIHKIIVHPWRFDVARNMAMDFVPNDIDVCVSIDLDELLVDNWREIIENTWQLGITTRMHYKYVWNFDKYGQPLTVFFYEKFHARHNYRWVNYVHEILQPIDTEEVHVWHDEIMVTHHADTSKSRSQYLNLLKQDVTDNPNNDRNSHYLGREYYFIEQYQSAIQELVRHLNLPSAVWKAERCASMRYIAKCYEAWFKDNSYQDKNVKEWYYKAIAEDENSKEARIDFATYLYQRGDYAGALHFCLEAIAINITNPQEYYLLERYAQNEAAYDIGAICYHYLGIKNEALTFVNKAIELNPLDMRISGNLEYIKQTLLPGS